MIKKCAFCGQEFEANNGMSKFCKRKHYKTCVVCGQEFEVPFERLGAKDLKNTCSRKCTTELRKSTNIEKYGGVAPACSEEVREKMQSTNLKRFGVKHAAQADVIKVKSKKTNLERYGEEYYNKTDEGRARISDRWKDDNYKEKVFAAIKETNLERYGVQSTLSVPEFREKARQTYKEKTGYEYSFQNPEVQEKLREGSMKKYGTPYVFQSEGGKYVIKRTLLERYGVDNSMKCSEIREKAKNTNLERYGFEYYLQSPEGKASWGQKMLEKYGHRYYSQTPVWRKNRMRDPDKFEQLEEFNSDPKTFILRHFPDKKPYLTDISDLVGVNPDAVKARIEKYDCTDMVDQIYSVMETQVYDFLLSICPEIEIIRNTRKYIPPYELDLYMPELQFAIECNPSSTHNSSINTWDITENPTPVTYHQKKTELCKKNGITLYHIFGYDWKYKKDIVKSNIKNWIESTRTSCTDNIDIQFVDKTLADTFLNANHILGSTKASIYVGTYTDNKLVAVMSLRRSTLEATNITSSNDESNVWEIVRYAEALDSITSYSLDGMIQYFLGSVSCSSIYIRVDNAHPSYNWALQSHSFKYIRTSYPNYVWVNVNTEKFYTGLSGNKIQIQKLLGVPDEELSKTERELMISRNYVQVYDSGQDVYLYTGKE